MSGLSVDGERVIEEDYMRSRQGLPIYLMHKASYEFAREFVRGRRVLDLGCGSGYGAAAIAEDAATVTAVDVSADAIAHASARYLRDNLRFQVVAPGTLPFDTGSFDVVLSFQVIEHVEDDAGYVREAWRVLADDGVMVMITPDRRHRLLPGQRPWNRWHLREYDGEGLRALVAGGGFAPQMQFMAASGETARRERSRYGMLKWLTWPVTFPGAPEWWRRYGLDALHGLAALRPRTPEAPPAAATSVECSLADLEIGDREDGSLNLVAVARKHVHA